MSRPDELNGNTLSLDGADLEGGDSGSGDVYISPEIYKADKPTSLELRVYLHVPSSCPSLHLMMSLPLHSPLTQPHWKCYGGRFKL